MEQDSEKAKILEAKDNFIKVGTEGGIVINGEHSRSPLVITGDVYAIRPELRFAVHKIQPPIRKFFEYLHLPEELQKVSKPFYDLANLMGDVTPDNEEKLEGYRKLLEAKDCFVRANIK